MTITEWLGLAAICFLGAATPGPSLVVIMNHSIRSGLLAGQIASFSHAFAILLYALATVFGLATLFENYPSVFNTFSILGACYLLYLAFKLIVLAWDISKKKQREASLRDNQDTLEQTKTRSRNNQKYSSAAKDAFFIAFLNPKLAIFFVALFSQFIPQGELQTVTTSLLVGTVFLIDFLWYLVVCHLIEYSKARITMKNQHIRYFYLAQSLIFIAIASQSFSNAF